MPSAVNLSVIFSEFRHKKVRYVFEVKTQQRARGLLLYDITQCTNMLLFFTISLLSKVSRKGKNGRLNVRLIKPEWLQYHHEVSK